MQEELGLEGPHQSIHRKTECAVDLVERFSTTLDSVCNGSEFKGTKFESNDAMRFANGECPDIKEDALLRLLPDLAVK